MSNVSIESKRLDNLVKKVGSGITPKGGSSSYKLSGIPFIRSQNVRDNRIVFDDIAYIDNVQHKKMSGSVVQNRDVLLNITGASIGRSAVYEGDDEANVNQHVCIIRTNESLNPYYLNAWLTSKFGQKQIQLCQAGGNREGLNFQQIRSFKIPLVTLGEQTKIAQLLSTWDKSIEATERLLENSKKRKKALMQQLLTGKKRLPGFHGGWKKIEIREFCEIYDGTHQTPNYVENGIPFFSVEHLTAGNFSKTKFIEKVIFDKESEKKKIRRGDILMTRIGDIGTIKLVDWDFESTFYVSLALIRAYGEISPEFLSYYMKGVDFQRELWQRTIHVAFPKKINLGDIGKCKIGIPPLNEQLRICEMLRPFFQEEDVINKKLEILGQQKIALMQQLLTGKKRIKFEEAD